MEEEDDNLTVHVPSPAGRGSPSSDVVTTSSPCDGSIVASMSSMNKRFISMLEEKDCTIAELKARVTELEAELLNNKAASQAAVLSNLDASPSMSSPESYIRHHLGSVSSNTVKLIGAGKQSTAQAVDNVLLRGQKGTYSNDTEQRMEPVHETDTQIVISRYENLEKGSKGKKRFEFDATTKIFKSSPIIGFAEDSPSFRHKIDVLDENVESLRAHLQHLVTVTRSYCNAGNSFYEHGRELASALLRLHGESWLTRLGVVAHILVHFGETLDEIQNYVEAFLLSLENTFTAPMEEFVKREVKNIRKMKTVVQRTSEEYELSLSRLLHVKNNSTDSLVAEGRLSDMATAQKRFECARFDLVHHLNELETKKKIQLVERVCNALYAFLGFFHQCHTEVAKIEPSMRDMQHALHFARKDFARSNCIWNAKRVNLERELDRKFVLVWKMSTNRPLHWSHLTKTNIVERRCSSTNDSRLSDNESFHLRPGSFQSTKDRSISYSHSNTKPLIGESGNENSMLTVATSTTTDTNREPKESGPIIYSGYLWKRNSGVRGSIRRKYWKRRWFSLQSGALLYEKHEIPPKSFIVVSNIELCTVRAHEEASAYKFCFDIIGPRQHTCTLQAENEVSYRAWMEAIKLEIESMLCLELKRNSNTSSSISMYLPVVVEEYSTPTILDVEVETGLQHLTILNNTCADCGAPDPKWASINLGVLICLECSGCHRSMGVHVSKVRSLNLDRWHLSLVQLMDKIGNKKLNNILEVYCREGTKPSPDSERTYRDAFIQSKYVSKSFMSRSSVDSSSEVQSRALYSAAFIGDVEAALFAILHGGDVSWANPEEGMATSTHQAVIGGNLLLLELLFLNGASLDAVNDEDEAPLDISLRIGDGAIISFLACRWRVFMLLLFPFPGFSKNRYICAEFIRDCFSVTTAIMAAAGASPKLCN